MRKFHSSHQKYDPENSAVLRYIRAGLQPFKRPLFLGSAAVLAVIAVCGTLYWQHPEWLDTTIEQPNAGEPGLDLDPGVPGEGAVDGIGAEFGSEVPAQPPGEISESDLEAAPSIFPALPGTSAEGELETSPDLVERSSFDNYRSFFDGSRSGTSPSNLGEGRGTGAINERAINNDLPVARPAPSRDNPLQDAVDRAFSSQSDSVEEEASVTPPNSAPNFNADRRQRIRDFNTFTDTSDSAPYGTVPLNSGGDRPNLGQTSEGNRLNGYDFNNSFSPIEQPQERFEQNNFDSSQYEENYLGTTEVNPDIEIQEPIQIEQPEFE